VVTDEEERAVPYAELPYVTPLVPAYRETEVIQRCLRSRRDRVIRPIGGSEAPARTGRPRTPSIAIGDMERAITLKGSWCPSRYTAQAKGPDYACRCARGRSGDDLRTSKISRSLQLRRAAVRPRSSRVRVRRCMDKLSYRKSGRTSSPDAFTQVRPCGSLCSYPASLPPCSDPLGGTSNHFRGRSLRTSGNGIRTTSPKTHDLGIDFASDGFHRAHTWNR